MHGKSSKRPKKGLGEDLHPPGTLFGVGPKSKNFTVFHYLTCHVTHNQHVDFSGIKLVAVLTSLNSSYLATELEYWEKNLAIFWNAGRG